MEEKKDIPISRSGRVLKKTVKMLEMETDTKMSIVTKPMIKSPVLDTFGTTKPAIKKIILNQSDQSTSEPIVRITNFPIMSEPKQDKTIDQKEPVKSMFVPIEQASTSLSMNTPPSTSKKNIFHAGTVFRSIQEQRRANQARRLQEQALQKSPVRTVQVYKHSVHDKRKKPSAYVLWCKENRTDIQTNYPTLSFIDLSKKMGEIWHKLPQNEKEKWFSMANSISKGAIGSPYNNLQTLDEDFKPKVISGKKTRPITFDMTRDLLGDFELNENNECVIDGETHKIDIKPIDIQAYLNVLGDSLINIGKYLERGIKYESEINYTQEDAISTLLDTLLITISSLIALTSTLPCMEGNKDKYRKLMDNVSILMPPSNLN